MRAFAIAGLLLLIAVCLGDPWTSPRRGSWHRSGPARNGDLVLVPERGPTVAIVVSASEPSNVQQAARFLQQDIQTLSGRKPRIVRTRPATGPTITIRTRRDDPRWEAYSVRIGRYGITIEGSDKRGTAFGVYELSERMGIDPLYQFTGYVPFPERPFVLRPGDFKQGPPLFKYRGLFHDDEDILPRPFDARNGTPYVRGTVPKVWYQRFFETALRLKMNQVAPYTRTERHFEIQKMASDWGLFYSSHHYDILLSNPYGFDRFGLAKKRNAGTTYDWFTNRDGLLRYWKAGVEENKNLDAIYPVGLRSTEDAAYSWPKNLTAEERNRIYSDAIKEQVAMAKSVLPPDKMPLFHFTMYGEMLQAFQQGQLDVPPDVMLIWNDDGDGVMRALPETLGQWKHGVYYHLAYFGGSSKQSVHTVQPRRIEEQFRRIVKAGATEYCLVNVSEMREHVMEIRLLSDIFWHGSEGLAKTDAAKRFVDWWCREYFPSAPAQAEQCYDDYYDTIREYNDIWYGSVRVRDWLNELMKKFNGESFTTPTHDEVAALAERQNRYARAMRDLDAAYKKLSPQQGQFLFEHCALGMLLDYRPVESALLLARALQATDPAAMRHDCVMALAPLEQLESEIKQAQRPPFAGWYRATWIRSPDFFSSTSDMNVHRPYVMMRRFLEGIGVKG